MSFLFHFLALLGPATESVLVHLFGNLAANPGQDNITGRGRVLRRPRDVASTARMTTWCFAEIPPIFF